MFLVFLQQCSPDLKACHDDVSVVSTLSKVSVRWRALSCRTAASVLAQHHGVGITTAELQKHNLGSLLLWLSKINCWNTKTCSVGITLPDSQICASSSVLNARRAVQSNRPVGAVASDRYIFGFEVQDGTDVCVGFGCNIAASQLPFVLQYNFASGQLTSGVGTSSTSAVVKSPYRPAVGDTVWFSLNVEARTCSIHVLRKPKSTADKMFFAVPSQSHDDSNVVTLLKSQFGVSYCGFITVAENIPLPIDAHQKPSSNIFWPTAVLGQASVLLLWCSFVDNYSTAT